MKKFLKWISDEGVDWAKNFVMDLKSIRSVLNWIYCVFYIWLVHYSITRNPASMNTAITVTGGVVSVIFSSYVLSKSYEKVNIKFKQPKDEGDSGSSD